MTLKKMIAALQSNDCKYTFLGVGPVSENVIKATFRSCKKYDCPPLFIASRNQVDLKEFGYGYLMGGMDQSAFCNLISEMQKEVDYTGDVYICRDHGGPWQRNVELDEKYPIDKAMDIARKSFRADIEAGFNYLHIDPTKCPHDFTQDDLIDWTVELLEYCEEQRGVLGKDEIDYEIGTEDIQGGLTSNQTFESFLEKIVQKLEEKNLPMPTCIVGQTGTLCKIDRNCGHFDRDQTAQLVEIAKKYGVGLKEHNGDYMGVTSVRVHKDIGVSGMNVAPEFGLVETEAYLHLAKLEKKLLDDKWIESQDYSGVQDLFLEKTFCQSPWGKWMTSDIKKLSEEEICNDHFLRLLIARVCGHYVYDLPEVKKSIRKLLKNIDTFNVIDADANEFVVGKISEAIDLYLENFNLNGINSKCLMKTN